jgi:hypothetical protein
MADRFDNNFPIEVPEALWAADFRIGIFKHRRPRAYGPSVSMVAMLWLAVAARKSPGKNFLLRPSLCFSRRRPDPNLHWIFICWR